MPTTPRLRAGMAAAALALVLPAAAQGAVTQQVHNDGGVYVPMTPGLAITNMEPRVTISAPPADADRYYKFSVTGPNGAVVAAMNVCLRISSGAVERTVNFVGNGAYTMTTNLFSDVDCGTPVAGGATGAFAINGGAVVQTPTTPLLTRDPGQYAIKGYTFPAAASPNGRQQILYRNQGVFDPVQGISGATPGDSLFALNGQTTATFRTPGRYTLTTRAGAGFPQAFTPWTPPQFIDVKAPFDLLSSRFIDSRGPSYRLRLQFRETAIAGRVRLRVRKSPGGKYRTIGRVKARNGVVTKRFTLRRTGRYQLRAEYSGDQLIAGGTIRLGFRVTRRGI